MEEQNHNANHGNADTELAKFLVIGAVVIFAAIALIYLFVFALVGGAIYLGAKIGASGDVGGKPSYKKVHEIEAVKQENLKQLDGESDDLKELVATKFENEKMELYRDDDRPEPLISINADAVKTVARKVVKRVAQKMTEKTK